MKVLLCCIVYFQFISYILSSSTNKDDVVPVTIVVSYCKQSLAWLSSAIETISQEYPQYVVQDVQIFSKCGRRVIDAPNKSSVVALPNVGRCDHTYAHFIAEMKLTEGVVLFLKDTRHVYWQHKIKNVSAVQNTNFNKLDRFKSEDDKKSTRADESYEGLAFVNDYGDMIHKAQTPTQFSCRQYINSEKTGIANAVITKILLTWSRDQYAETQKMYSLDPKDETPFSIHANMLQWVNEMNISIPRPLTSVCYGGVFAVSVKRLLEIDKQIWRNLQSSLSRGNNIQEGHFMERAWSAMLAHNNFPYFRPKVRCFRKDICGYFGNIVVKWKTLRSTSICQTKLHTFADMKYITNCHVRKTSALDLEMTSQKLKKKEQKNKKKEKKKEKQEQEQELVSVQSKQDPPPRTAFGRHDATDKDVATAIAATGKVKARETFSNGHVFN
jgi:hypothetical protein